METHQKIENDFVELLQYFKGIRRIFMFFVLGRASYAGDGRSLNLQKNLGFKIL